jgi:hypothetical protein
LPLPLWRCEWSESFDHVGRDDVGDNFSRHDVDHHQRRADNHDDAGHHDVTATSTSTTTSTTQSSIPSTTTIPTPSLTFAVNTSPCGLTQVNATLVGACSFTATANFPASNYQFTVGGVSFTPGSATLASGWSVNCGVLGSANSGTQAINVMAGVSASATNTNTGQTVTATTQQILFSKPAGAC